MRISFRAPPPQNLFNVEFGKIVGKDIKQSVPALHLPFIKDNLPYFLNIGKIENYFRPLGIVASQQEESGDLWLFLREDASLIKRMINPTFIKQKKMPLKLQKVLDFSKESIEVFYFDTKADAKTLKTFEKLSLKKHRGPSRVLASIHI